MKVNSHMGFAVHAFSFDFVLWVLHFVWNLCEQIGSFLNLYIELEVLMLPQIFIFIFNHDCADAFSIR